MTGRCAPSVRRLSTSKILWATLVVVGLLYLSAQSGWYGFDATALGSTRVAQTMLGPDGTGNLQLYPASHPAIHVGFRSIPRRARERVCRDVGLKGKLQYVGRWTATPNRLGKDGTFPGLSCPMSLHTIDGRGTDTVGLN